MSLYRLAWPVVRHLPPEFAHAAGLQVLRLPFRLGTQVSDPFTWHGITFRNRSGIAAGFDKNAECIRGIERLGAGFFEAGTILVEPWAGNPVAPRLSRLLAQRGVWNRLGFTSEGLAAAARRLARTPRAMRRGLVVACNIGPHPGRLKESADPLRTAGAEFRQLVESLHPHCEMFVVNLSSPNTPRLRSLLQSPDLVDAVIRPTWKRVRELDASSAAARHTPLLVKLPPEDMNREPWTDPSLHAVVEPLLRDGVCDGFVAVNTSVRLAEKLVHMPPDDLPGGVSGEPIRAEALRVVAMLRRLIGPDRLLIGCGGVMAPAHAIEFRHAGADLVELYTGMIYAGPGLVSRCAAQMHQSSFGGPTRPTL
jgi:dihydroorotate dehydrogenase